MTQQPVMEIENLEVSYFTRAGEIPAVTDFNLRLEAGEAVGVVGESGCGKTTVAMAIMRYLGSNGRIVGGTMHFQGRDLLAMGKAELRALRGSDIAMVYQEPMAALNPAMTIGSQLMEVPRFHDNATRAQAYERSCNLLADVRLADTERIMAAYPHQLSGGQQQRAVIAMALLSSPKLLLLDEPTTALDVTVEAGIVDLIRDLAAKYGTGMVYISHNLGLIRETCDQVCVMYSGKAVEKGSVDQLFDAPRHPYTRGLFDCIALPSTDKLARPLKPIRGQLPLPHMRPPGCAFGPRCDHFKAGICDQQGLEMRDTGGSHEVRCALWSEINWDALVAPAAAEVAQPVGAEVIGVRDMSKYYAVQDKSLMAMITGRGVRYVKANESLNFAAREGETVAIVGESGCGKSTFAKVLMGLETATEGSIEFQGQDIASTDVQKRSSKQVGALQMVFQNPYDTLNPSQSVGAQIGRAIRKFDAAVDRKKARVRVLELLDLVKLPRDFINRRPRQLSGGQKQRVGIARAFAGNPSAVVADEPVSALDVSVAAAVTSLLLDIQRRNKTTLLFISHDLGLVRYLADRVVVMYLGQIMEQGTTDEVFSPPYHPYTEALLSALPVADPRVRKKRIILEGDLPSPLNPPKGCPFASRCPRKIGAICETTPPVAVSNTGHAIACHISIEDLAEIEPVFSMVEADAAE